MSKVESNPLLSSLILNGVFFFLVLAVYHLHFRTNDDVGMLLRMSGTSLVTESSPYVWFIHIFLSSSFQFLYSIAPSFSWYTIFLLVLLFASFTTIGFGVIKYCKVKLALVAYLGILILLGIDILVGLQFTIVASVACCAGYFLLLVRKKNEKSVLDVVKSPELVVTLLLLVFGSMLRWNSFMLITALFIPSILFIELLKLKAKGLLIRTGVPIFIVILCFGLSLVNKSVYSAKEDLASFQKFNDLRTKFVDYGVFANTEEEVAIAALQKASWSLTDANMLMAWFFVDENIYNIANFQAVLDELPTYKTKMNLSQAYEILKNKIGPNEFSSKSLWFMLCLLPLLRWRWSTLVSVLPAILIFVAICLYLVYFLKPPPPRVYYGMFLALCLIALPQIEFPSDFKNLRLSAVGLFVIVALLQTSDHRKMVMTESNKYHSNNVKWMRQIRSIDLTNDVLYVRWGTAMPWQYFKPFQKISDFQHYSEFGLGTYQRDPTAKRRLDSREIDDLYLEIVHKPEVQLMVNSEYNLRLFIQYVKEHYDLVIVPQLTQQTTFFGMFNFNIQTEPEDN